MLHVEVERANRKLIAFFLDHPVAKSWLLYSGNFQPLMIRVGTVVSSCSHNNGLKQQSQWEIDDINLDIFLDENNNSNCNLGSSYSCETNPETDIAVILANAVSIVASSTMSVAGLWWVPHALHVEGWQPELGYVVHCKTHLAPHWDMIWRETYWPKQKMRSERVREQLASSSYVTFWIYYLGNQARKRWLWPKTTICGAPTRLVLLARYDNQTAFVCSYLLPVIEWEKMKISYVILSLTFRLSSFCFSLLPRSQSRTWQVLFLRQWRG